jgi:hypothetical protein
MTLSTWIIAFLTVGLPTDFALVQQHSDRVAIEQLPDAVVKQEFRSAIRHVHAAQE